MQHLPLTVIEALLKTNQQGLVCFDFDGEVLYEHINDLEYDGALTWQTLCPHVKGTWEEFIEHLPTPYLLQHRRTNWYIDANKEMVCAFIDSIQPWQHLQNICVMVLSEQSAPRVWCNGALKSLLQTPQLRTLDDLTHIQWQLPKQDEGTPGPWDVLDADAAPINMIAELNEHTHLHLRIETQHIGGMRFLFFEDLSEYVEQAQQQKELLSIASHELRNPLTPLKGLLQLAILQHEEENTVDFNLLQKAESQVTRLVRLANTLLDVSRLDSGQLTNQKESVDSSTVLEETINFWIARYGKNRINLSLPETEGKLALDLSAFEQVINNLLDNAIKFSPTHEPIFVTLKHTGDEALILVEDRGVGIDPNHIPHLFKRFYQGEQSKKTRGSLGLGLYISHKIVLEHGGSITIDSKRGGPTIITLRFPLQT